MDHTITDLSVVGIRSASRRYWLRVRSRDATGYMDAAEYMASPNAAISKLMRQDIYLAGNRRRRVVEAAGAVEDFRDEPLLDRIGWNGPHFAYPDGTIFSPPDTPYADTIFERQPDKVHRAGSLSGWLRRVASPLAGHPICEFFMMLPFAGPLRAKTDRVENFGWEIIGPRARGKSTLLHLMASTAGGSLGGEEGDFGLSFAATAAGIESAMRHYSDLIMIIDEGNLFELDLAARARGTKMSKLMMSLGKGQEKLRFESSPSTFRFVFATSSNESLSAINAGTSADSVLDAVADRLMTISIENRPFGVFEHLQEDYDEIGDFTAALARASALHHGTALPHFLQGLVDLCAEDEEAFRARLDGNIARFRARVEPDPGDGSARRVADAFGLVYTAGLLAQRLGALPAGYSCMEAALECYRLYQAATSPTLRPAEQLVALAEHPEVIELDNTGLRHIRDRRFAELDLFVQTRRDGTRQLMIKPSAIRRFIPNWTQARKLLSVKSLLVRDKDRYTADRRVRSNGDAEPMICVVLPNGKA